MLLGGLGLSWSALDRLGRLLGRLGRLLGALGADLSRLGRFLTENWASRPGFARNGKSASGTCPERAHITLRTGALASRDLYVVVRT